MHISLILVYIVCMDFAGSPVAEYTSAESKASYSILTLAQPKQNVGTYIHCHKLLYTYSCKDVRML